MTTEPAVISEDSSKKPKRGRPPTCCTELMAGLRQIFSDCKTDRGVVEAHFYSNAYMAIREVYDADPGANRWAEYYAASSRGHVFHKAVLSALGRIEDNADIVEWARIIAEKKLSTRAAVATIRNWRLGREDKPDYLQLVRNLENGLNAYLDGHPSMPKDWPVKALRDLADCIEDETD